MKARPSVLAKRIWPVGVVALLAPILPALARNATVASATPTLQVVCDQAPGDPAPGTTGWERRDLNDLECASQRQQDELSNPSFLRMWAIENGEHDPGTAVSRILAQLEAEDPTGPAGDIPATTVGDPFRDPTTWQRDGRGQQTLLTLNSPDGAHLNARLYWPNGTGPFPGVVMIPGLQAYNEVYEWLGEGLAESGYMVLIPDPQGQGGSQDLPHNPDGSIACGVSGCPGPPVDDPASDETQVAAMTSALDFLLSTPQKPDLDGDGGNPDAANARGTLLYNPEWHLLNPKEIGVAGHSNGAIAVTSAGQNDPRVKAVVSMDNLGGSIALAPGAKIHAPTLYFEVDYPFPSVLEPQNPDSPPNSQTYIDDTFAQTKAAGVDTMLIVPRASTHYEFDYLPFPSSLQASRYGERVAFYYTLAWFDKYLDRNILRDGHSAIVRLTAKYFDGSADASSIGAGTFDPVAAAADPTNPAAGNVPYKIKGLCISNLLSFYYQSAYWLNGGALGDSHIENPLGCPS